MALRAMGRPLDAIRLLTDAASRPGEQIAELLILLEDLGSRRDWTRVLEALPKNPLAGPGAPVALDFDARLIELVRVLHAAGRDHQDVSATLASLPDGLFAGELVKLRAAGADDVAHHVIGHLVRTDPEAAVRRLVHLKTASRIDAAVLRGMLRAADSPVRDSVEELRPAAVLALVRGSALPGAVVSSLTAAGLGRQVEEALAQFTMDTRLGQVIQLLGELHGRSMTEEAHSVVRGAGWMFPELYRDFVIKLWESGLPDYAVYALEWNAARLGRLLCEQLAGILRVPVPAAAGPPILEPPPPPSVTPRSRPWHRFGRG